MCEKSTHSLCWSARRKLSSFRDAVAATHRKLMFPLAFLMLLETASTQSLRQTLEPRLARLSTKSQSAVLLWDLPSSDILAVVRAEEFGIPRCLGSLLKPLLLLAYLSDLNERCSEMTSQNLDVPPCPRGVASSGSSQLVERAAVSGLRPCVGRATSQCPVECWFKAGHGTLDLTRALAASCNQYFYQLSSRTPPTAFFTTLAALRVNASSGRTNSTLVPPETMIGLDSSLRLVPLQVLRAYGNLISNHPSADVDASTPAFARAIVLGGLRLSAAEGTSVLAEQALPRDHHLLGKTGTSPAFVGGHYSKSRTDGWFLGFYPAAQPVLAVMVYYPGGLGAKDAAPLGGQAIRIYLEAVTESVTSDK